jgi:hypothetical protein
MKDEKKYPGGTARLAATIESMSTYNKVMNKKMSVTEKNKSLIQNNMSSTSKVPFQHLKKGAGFGGGGGLSNSIRKL